MPSPPALTFFLNAQGGSLAFVKEADVASFSADFGPLPLHSSVSSPATPPDNGDYATLAINVTDYRSGVLQVRPDNVAAEYTIQLWGAVSTNTQDPQMFKLLDGKFTDLAGTVTLPLMFFGLTHFWVGIEATTHPLTIAVGIHRWQQAQP